MRTEPPISSIAREPLAPELAPASSSAPTELAVGGMTCQHCVRSVNDALQSIPGVDRAIVDLEAGRARVVWKSGANPNSAELVRVVTEAGYKAELITQSDGTVDGRKPRSSWSPLAGWQFNVIFGAAVTIPLLVCEWVFRAGMERWYHWLSFVLVLPLQIVGGARFYLGAWHQLKARSANMDTLVALGSTTAFVFSVWGLFSRTEGHLFFMESAAIITLISFGHWLEAKASQRAAGALRALLNLAPPVARRLNAQQQEEEIPVSQLVIGDLILLKPGDRVPTDAEVFEGSSAVDESMLTGESLPIDKSPKDAVYAGTVNLNGRLVARVTATGERTALAHIIAVVQRAQTSRADIQRLGDRVSSVFVPVVVLFALAIALGWFFLPAQMRLVSDWAAWFLWPPTIPAGAIAAAVYAAAAILIIACPCAMGLATPAAIMAGTNAAAARGILIRDGSALEKSGRITGVIFDKTGTLTEAKLVVSELRDLRPPSTAHAPLKQIAASLANPSHHPLSRAVAQLDSAAVAVTDWREHRGAGVEGKLPSRGTAAAETFRLGSIRWLNESGVDVSAGNEFAQQWAEQGASILGLSTGEQLIGVLALRDTLKACASEVIAQLQKSRKKIYLLTGDNRRTATAIARQLGIPNENVFAEIRPEQKADIIARLQKQGERIAFVGDGINDAPALEQADLGIAVSRASDVAREAADIILLNSDIHAIPEALGLAQATLRTIKQNLFWAFFYNAAAVPLAAFGFLSPVLSALAMGISDLLVIGNALRLRWWKGPTAP